MPKHRVEITKAAESDLREIFHYIAADNEVYKINFFNISS